MDTNDLKALEGRRVELHFRNGHVVRSRLVDVDEGSPGREIVYDDLQVVDWGDLEPGSIDVHSAAAASLDQLVDAREVPE